MATNHLVDLTVTLVPIWHIDPPEVIVEVNHIRRIICLDTEKKINFNFYAAGPERLSMTFINKRPSDTIPEKQLDKAVIIKSIDFFGIEDARFIWAGKYTPEYDTNWVQEQTLLGTAPLTVLTNTDRLSWNGTWVLEFDIPVFTWIHRLQSLGWIYGT
jgi:hypothetical protein